MPLRRRLDWQAATVRRVETKTPTVKSFFLEPAEPFAYRAGQHVDVRLTAPDGYSTERSYSIASAPETAPLVELTVELLEGGEVSPFFHEVVEPGDTLEIRGPIGGHFVWRVAEGGPVLLVGGGSGVVPLMGMARHRAAQRADVPMLLFFSARHWDEVIFRDELLDLEARGDGFSLALALTREPARREADFGRRIDGAAAMAALARLPAPPRVAYVCGSNPFVEAATAALMEAGIPAPVIRTERYGG
ncbi:FAD-binding oxidoreductase [Prosthecomicrobium pneumaticum]|nr:FAD-binding oxidoreductase [Prosthecomicrobium pneumaticum]